MGRATVSLAVGLVLIGLAAGCTGSGSGSDGGDEVGGSTSEVTRPPTELRWRTSGFDVVCDGTERLAGTVEQARPGEVIEYTTPLPVDVPDGRADDDGQAELTWSCDTAEAGLRWDLTATGVDSGRTVQFTVAGAPVAAADAPPTIDLYDDELVCDGRAHEIAALAGFEPGERIDLDSEQGEPDVRPRADRTGGFTAWWRCRPGDVGETWRITAIGATSGRSVDFTLRGVAWPDAQPVAVESAVEEIACDRRTHPLATMVNLYPGELVTFTAPGARNVRDGRADADGRLELTWQCERADVGETWELTAIAADTGERVTLPITGVPGETPPPATVRVVEEPFVCDDERRPAALLGDLEPGEFVDFTSPQAGPLLEGRFEGGELEVNWQCQPSQAGTAWEVTATGRQSGRSITFAITGVAP